MLTLCRWVTLSLHNLAPTHSTNICRRTILLYWFVYVCNSQSSGLAGEDLVKTLEGLGLDESPEGGGGADDGNILPIMQSIMQNLLSKEVLYPSLKEITGKVCIGFILPFSFSS